MAPPGRAREPSVEPSTEADEFIQNVSVYYQQRGTNFDPEPRLGNRRVDLYRLFKAVVERGGYDAVSAEKLLWRKLGQEIGLGSTSLASLAFQLKSTYYKNLAAYEISTVHGKVPPPREILEDISARGGDLLTRTLENFRPPGTSQGQPANGEDSELGLGEGPNTPSQVTGEVEEAITGGRSIRAALQPAYPEVATLQKPKSTGPVPLRPVLTPGNNPSLFKERVRAARDNWTRKRGEQLKSDGVMSPGTGFPGPNIYIRCLLGLKSGIQREQDFALFHLVKISYERGDRFKFEIFPALADALISKALEVAAMFFDVQWTVSYDANTMNTSLDVLNGLEGTPDLLDRIQACTRLQVVLDMHSEDFRRCLTKITEACLVLRNLVLLDKNAEFLAAIHSARDMIVIVLNLPRTPLVVEMQHYVLEIAEHLTARLALSSEDPLYVSLVGQLESQDRGKIILALRALARISLFVKGTDHQHSVPSSILKRLCHMILLDDEDLSLACADFLHRYLAVEKNVKSLVKSVSVHSLVAQLVRQLLHGAQVVMPNPTTQAMTAPRGAETSTPIDVPREIFDQLMAIEEPERSAMWLHCVLVEDPNYEIPQVEIWKAYTDRFPPSLVGDRNLPASDFIKHVSIIFSGAAAHAVDLPNGGQRYVIRGIRWRSSPTDLEGRVLHRCLWWNEPSVECGKHLAEMEEIYDHVLDGHLQVPKVASGRYDTTIYPDRQYKCQWAGCRRFWPDGTNRAHHMAAHIKVHLSDITRAEVERARVEERASQSSSRAEDQAPRESLIVVPVDERGQPIGLPFAVLELLKQLARQLPKLDQPDGHESWIEIAFALVKHRLLEIMGQSNVMRDSINELMAAIAAGERASRQIRQVD
ncbi:MAG: Chromatin structure-remodeling complex protein rsc9 [Phylliscum demangeonii]|nr:MAG: Chromatin structure-remodeling complex protein rsc9 [Phylliscum demangeonii]